LVAQARDKWNIYFRRYSSDWHCYLIEKLSDYGASAGVKLNEVCSIFGIPRKFDVDGTKVSEMIDQGKILKALNYCETHVLNTYSIYL
jgi:predicted PolB exonuclease-like 3'-5' exonuclease